MRAGFAVRGNNMCKKIQRIFLIIFAAILCCFSAGCGQRIRCGYDELRYNGEISGRCVSSFSRMSQWKYTEKRKKNISILSDIREITFCVPNGRKIRLRGSEDQIEGLDFNGLYEYFYMEEYGREIDTEKCAKGIPQEEFESLLTKYLPVTAEQLREYASYDPENDTHSESAAGRAGELL